MAWVIVVSFLAIIVLFTLAARYGTQYAGQILGKRVSAAHHAAEQILDTEQIPREWIGPAPGQPAREPMWARRQKQRAIRKLKKLRSYMERTPCFSDVESREYVLGELGRIEKVWRQAEPTALVGTQAGE